MIARFFINYAVRIGFTAMGIALLGAGLSVKGMIDTADALASPRYAQVTGEAERVLYGENMACKQVNARVWCVPMPGGEE